MLRRMDLLRTESWEERVASIFGPEIIRQPGVLAVAHELICTLKMEAARSCETSVLTRPIRRHIPEDGILHSRRRDNLKP
jgi:hypothetical protein